MERLQLRSRCRYARTIMTMVIGWCVPLSAVGNVNKGRLGLPFHLLPRGLQDQDWVQEDDAGRFSLPQQTVILLLCRAMLHPMADRPRRKKNTGFGILGPVGRHLSLRHVHCSLETRPPLTPFFPLPLSRGRCPCHE